nr:MAG TPA: hypothetical protein [Caudoviricetes sp.]
MFCPELSVATLRSLTLSTPNDCSWKNVRTFLNVHISVIGPYY